jgi:hypothetical protein
MGGAIVTLTRTAFSLFGTQLNFINFLPFSQHNLTWRGQRREGHVRFGPNWTLPFPKVEQQQDEDLLFFFPFTTLLFSSNHQNAMLIKIFPTLNF